MDIRYSAILMGALLFLIPGCLDKDEDGTIDDIDDNGGPLWNFTFVMSNRDPDLPSLNIRVRFNDVLRVDHTLNFTAGGNGSAAFGEYAFRIRLPDGRYDVDVEVPDEEQTQTITFFAAGDYNTSHPLYIISYEPVTATRPGLNVALAGSGHGTNIDLDQYKVVPVQ